MAHYLLYDRLRLHWTGDVGGGVRSLLNLKKSPGAFIWFSSALEDSGKDCDTLNVGECVRVMLMWKLRRSEDAMNDWTLSHGADWSTEEDDFQEGWDRRRF